MGASTTSAGFFIWGIDHAAYGPVELPTLVSWVKDDRVTAETWVYVARSDSWIRAGTIPELQMFFGRKSSVADQTSARGIDARALRRIRILGGMSDADLERLAEFVEICEIPQWSVCVKQGEPGDGMYFILQGEMRVRIQAGGRETILATLSTGDFFGDIALFDKGPRSADVVANTDAVLAKLSSSGFEQLSNEAPELATPFLKAIGKTMGARIRTDNKRAGNSLNLGL